MPLPWPGEPGVERLVAGIVAGVKYSACLPIPADDYRIHSRRRSPVVA